MTPTPSAPPEPETLQTPDMSKSRKAPRLIQIRADPTPGLVGYATTAKPTPATLDSIPKEYHDFSEVFSKAKANVLADHQPYYLKITLDEGTTPLLGPIYSLSQNELKALHKFIDENIATGFIYPTCSPHGAPVLFIKRKMVPCGFVATFGESTTS